MSGTSSKGHIHPGAAGEIALSSVKSQEMRRLEMNRSGDVKDSRSTTYLIEPDSKVLKVIATNSVDENQHTNASLAFAGGKVHLRTDAFLYAVK